MAGNYLASRARLGRRRIRRARRSADDLGRALAAERAAREAAERERDELREALAACEALRAELGELLDRGRFSRRPRFDGSVGRLRVIGQRAPMTGRVSVMAEDVRRAVVSIDELVAAADVAWLREVVREKYEAVYVDVRADHEIALSTADHGHEAQPEGIVIGCAVDARYLLDAIEACPTPYAWVHFERRHLAPLRVTSARHDWSAMVMPRRSCATNSARDIVPRDPDCPCRDCTTERADRAERAKLWLPGLHHGPRAPGEAVPRG